MEGHMVSILNFEQTEDGKVQPIFNDKAITEIFSKPECEGVPFLVISVNGIKRSGKSFLCNLIICYLRYLSKNPYGSQWLEGDPEIIGVEWKRGRDSVTQGVYMWSEPFIIQVDGDKKVGVALMDCQGLFDQNKNQTTIDAIVALCGLEMSKVHIVNLKGDLNAADLTHLHSCITYAGSSSLNPLFNKLLLVHRNWQEDDTFGYRPEYFQSLMGKRDLNEVEQVICKAFTECSEFMVPIPGVKIREASVDKGVTLQDLLKEEDSRKFFRQIEELFELLFTTLASQEECLTSQECLLTTVQKLKMCWAGEILHFQSSAELMERRQIMDVYSELMLLVNELDADVLPQNCKSRAELEAALESAESKALALIEDCKVKIPGVTQVASATWQEVEMNALQLLCDFKARNIAKFVKLAQSNKIVKGLLAVGGAAAIGALTGGAGLAATGALMAFEVGLGCIATAVGGGAAAGATVGGITTAAVLGTKEKAKKKGQLQEKKNN